ncbi:MAG: hypothetical protein P9L92_05240 [Candidatus Electryonea clarkiae]|nr:hypothetical protein [Candidatus Electryonea clarkiae]MDP8286903.1 hypothetical protein [Candidatus Electryonea clarkiae]
MRHSGSAIKWKRLLALLLVASSALLFMQCTLDNPGLPSWDVAFVLTFSNEHFGLNGLMGLDTIVDVSDSLNDTLFRGVDTLVGGNLLYLFNNKIKPFALADQLELETDDTSDFTIYMEHIILLPSDVSDAHLRVDKFIPGWTGDGTYLIDTLQIPDSSSEVAIDSFRSITVVHCIPDAGNILTLEVTNNSPLTWSRIDISVAPADAPNHIIGSGSINEALPPQNVRTLSLDVDDKILKRHMVLIMTGSGLNQGNKNLTTNDGLDVRVSYGELNCDYVQETHISRQEPFTELDTIPFKDEEDWVIRGHVTSGVISINLQNHTEVEESLYITIPHFFTYQDTLDTMKFKFLLGSSLDPVTSVIDTTFILGPDSGTVGFRKDYLMTMDLPENYRMPDPEDQVLKFSTTVVPLGRFDDVGNSLPVTLSIRDTVNMEIFIETFDFEWMYGVVRDERMEIESIEEYIDFWEDQENMQSDLNGNLEFNDVGLIIDLTGSEYNSPAKLVLDISGFNSKDSIRTTETIERFFTPNQKVMYIDGVKDDIHEDRLTRLFNTFPDSLTISGNVLIGRDHFYGSELDPYEPLLLSKEDLFVGTVSLEAPFQISTINPTPIHGSVYITTSKSEDDTTGADSFPVNLEDMDIQKITLIAHTKNNLPMGVTVYFLAGHFASDSIATDSLVFSNIDRYNILTPPLRLEPPVMFEGRPVVSELEIDTFMTVIDDESMSLLSKDSMYTRQIIVLDQMSPINAHEDDYLEVELSGEIQYRVNDTGGD